MDLDIEVYTVEAGKVILKNFSYEYVSLEMQQTGYKGMKGGLYSVENHEALVYDKEFNDLLKELLHRPRKLRKNQDGHNLLPQTAGALPEEWPTLKTIR